MPEPVTVGELFDANDLVARWMFSLTAAVQDLSISEGLFKDALEEDAPLYRTSALFRMRPATSASDRSPKMARIATASGHSKFVVPAA